MFKDFFKKSDNEKEKKIIHKIKRRPLAAF